MINKCPNCEKNTGLEIIERPEVFKIKGEDIQIIVKLLRCNECESEFVLKELGDPFKAAYEVYRSKKGLIKPVEILEFRKKYKLTQKELGMLLGFGEITLSRYENGSLQDQVHDNLLRLAMEPKNLLQMVINHKDIFDDKKRVILLEQLSGELSWLEQIESELSNSRISEFNGQTPFQIEKISQVIEFLCFNRSIYKTKLMKLLFYSDFMHYKKYRKSITGLQYVHQNYGPVPDNYEFVLGYLTRIGSSIQLEPVDFERFSGEVVKVYETPNTSLLSRSEINVLRIITNKFEHYSSKDISLFSHGEQAYQQTSHKELISYSYADTINLD